MTARIRILQRLHRRGAAYDHAARGRRYPDDAGTGVGDSDVGALAAHRSRVLHAPHLDHVAALPMRSGYRGRRRYLIPHAQEVTLAS